MTGRQEAEDRAELLPAMSPSRLLACCCLVLAAGRTLARKGREGGAGAGEAGLAGQGGLTLQEKVSKLIVGNVSWIF